MAVKFSHTSQSHFYLESHSSLYHKLRRKLWKMGVLYLIFKRAFLFLFNYHYFIWYNNINQ